MTAVSKPADYGQQNKTKAGSRAVKRKLGENAQLYYLAAACKHFSMTNIEFNKNEHAMKMAWTAVRQKLETIYEGGGAKAAAKQKEKNKLKN